MLERASSSARSASLFVAVDGRSGSGKSTLAAVVAELMGSDDSGAPVVTVIEGDQFYGGGSANTWDRRSTEEKVAMVIDWPRQRAVLESLRRDGRATWHEFDWDSDDWDADVAPLAPEAVGCEASPVVILEGAYSARPELADLFDLRVLLEVSTEIRRRRLRERDGEAYQADWEQRWAAAEELYFSRIAPPESFDVVLRE